MLRNGKNKKVAVIVYNLGGPDKLEDIRKYLFNLFYDVLIIPNPFKWILAKFISYRREKTAKAIYSNLGGRSPLLKETLDQQKSLQESLNSEREYDYKVFTAMQCWKPEFKDILDKVIEFNPDKIITIPLYPQFSSVTTGVSIRKISRDFRKYKGKITNICCYYNEDKFIESHSELIFTTNNIEKLNTGKYRILFSAHGLPQLLVDRGDPYQFQIEEMVGKIVEKTGVKNLDWKITYQSRVGRIQWLKPDTEEEIIRAGLEKKSLIIVPISFVSEHVETLVELDIEYKRIADKYNIDYIRITTLRTNKMYMEMLKDLTIKATSYVVVCSDDGKRKCSANFKLCECK